MRRVAKDNPLVALGVATLVAVAAYVFSSSDQAVYAVDSASIKRCCGVAGDYCSIIPACGEFVEDCDHCTQAGQLLHLTCGCAGQGCHDDGWGWGTGGCGYEQAAECFQNGGGQWECLVNHVRQIACGRRLCHDVTVGP